MKRLGLWLVPFAILAAAPAASGQSLFGTSGLGVPLAPLDARTAALGGVGVGLIGMNASMVNPAEVAGIRRRGLLAAMQPSSRQVEFEGLSDRVTGTRFPLVRFFHPFGERGVISGGYGGFLDQNWGIISEGLAEIGGVPVPTEDAIESVGGIAQFQLAGAYQLSPTLAVGVGGGFYTGDLQRRMTRRFPEVEDLDLDPFETRTHWRYRGPLATAGFRWDPDPLVRVGASVTWAGELRAMPAEDDDSGETRRFQLPLQVAGGASGWLAPNLLATLGARWSGWSDFGGDVEADDTWNVGGGLEFSGGTARDRTFPLRLGFNYGTLPFRVQGEQPTEWAASVGLGAQLARTDLGPLAHVDAALEHGRRGDAANGGLAERFWRFTFSLSVFGR